MLAVTIGFDCFLCLCVLAVFAERHIPENGPDLDVVIPRIGNEELQKRGWNSLSGMWGKRDWNGLSGMWGKRNWNNPSEIVNKQGWNGVSGMWGKRDWNKLSGMWGKRDWNKLSGMWGKRDPYTYSLYRIRPIYPLEASGNTWKESVMEGPLKSERQESTAKELLEDRLMK